MRCVFLGVLIPLLHPVTPLGAQSTWPVREGSEVRIETSTNQVFRGAWLDGTGDSIRLRQQIRDSIIAVPAIAVLTYSVLHADRRRGATRGLLIGGGVALGLVAVLTAANRNDDASSVPIGLLLALPVTLLGGGIGAGVGASLATPRWSAPVAMPINRRVGLSVMVGYRF